MACSCWLGGMSGSGNLNGPDETRGIVEWPARAPAVPGKGVSISNPTIGYADPCNTLLLPAGQNGFALKQLGSPPGQEDGERDQDHGGNDRHEDGEFKLAGEFAENDPRDGHHRPYRELLRRAGIVDPRRNGRHDGHCDQP